MAGETLAFMAGYDSAYLLRHDLQNMLCVKIPLIMMTDSKQVFDVLTRVKYTTEKQLMVDIAAAREAYDENIISNFGLIRSEFNLADSMTKIGSHSALLTVMQDCHLKHPVEQFIIRSTNTSALGHQKPGNDSH